jgi:hypothetical protein
MEIEMKKKFKVEGIVVDYKREGRFVNLLSEFTRQGQLKYKNKTRAEAAMPRIQKWFESCFGSNPEEYHYGCHIEKMWVKEVRPPEPVVYDPNARDEYIEYED